MSTFIVECDEDSWRSAGFDRMDADQTIAACEVLFAEWLGGHKLVSNAAHRTSSPWTNFVRVKNAHWFHDNVVLVGDAAHSAHFSIGSGTKLAMEDAIALARASRGNGRRITRAAALSGRARHRVAPAPECGAQLDGMVRAREALHRTAAEQFAYQPAHAKPAVSHENLRAAGRVVRRGRRTLVREWAAASEREARSLAALATTVPAAPPMFTPFRLREMTLENRLSSRQWTCTAPRTECRMTFISCISARALLAARRWCMTEMVCVSRWAYLTRLHGHVHPEHAARWRRVVDFVHQWSNAKILPSARALWAKGLHQAAVGRRRRPPAGRRRLDDDRSVADSVRDVARCTARDDSRRHGTGAPGFRSGDHGGHRLRLRHARIARSAWLPGLELPDAR